MLGLEEGFEGFLVGFGAVDVEVLLALGAELWDEFWVVLLACFLDLGDQGLYYLQVLL